MAKKTSTPKVKAVTNKNSITFFEKYINNAAPTSFEISGQKLWLDYIRPYVDETYVDNYGTAVGIINPNAEYKVVIEAHADEISWFVNYIKQLMKKLLAGLQKSCMTKSSQSRRLN